MGKIVTYSGREFDFAKPDPDMISIEDIAHSLAYSCRYNGHCSQFYSTAQHSVLVASRCSQQNELTALLHDASETYAGDMVHGLKYMDAMKPYRVFEAQVEWLIALKFGLEFPFPAEIKKVDRRLAVTEYRDLFPNKRAPWSDPEYSVEPYDEKIVPWEPKFAELIFLNRFHKLTGGR